LSVTVTMLGTGSPVRCGGNSAADCTSLTLPGGIPARLERNREIVPGTTAPLTLTFASNRGLAIRLEVGSGGDLSYPDDPAARLDAAQLETIAQAPLLH
jgi:hypothetical protein